MPDKKQASFEFNEDSLKELQDSIEKVPKEYSKQSPKIKPTYNKKDKDPVSLNTVRRNNVGTFKIDKKAIEKSFKEAEKKITRDRNLTEDVIPNTSEHKSLPKAEKTIPKDYYEEQVDVIAKSYKANVDDYEDYAFGKVVDWGDIDVDALADTLIDFAEKLCNIKFWPYQREPVHRVIQSFLLNDGEEITLLFSRQSGKSTAMAALAATLMVMGPVLARHLPQLKYLERGVWIGVYAPTESQAKTIGDNIDRFLSRDHASDILFDPEINMHYRELSISDGNARSFCTVKTAAPNSKIESKTYHLILLDEAQDVSEEKIIKSIHPMLAAFSGSIVKIGTAINTQCEFLDAIQRNKRLIYETKGSVRNHFEYDYKVVCQYNKMYAKFIDKEIRRYGTDSDYFKMSYGLQWLLDKGMAITIERFNTSMRWRSGKIHNYPQNGYIYCAGLDLGKKYDNTVLTLFTIERTPKQDLPEYLDIDTVEEADYYTKKIANWFEWEGDNWTTQIHEIAQVLKDYNVSHLCIDVTGVGDPIHEMISKKCEYMDIEIEPVNFNQKTNHNLATLFFKNLNYKSLKVPSHQSISKSKRWNKFLGQLLDCEKVYNGNFLKITHPPGGAYKDDFVQSMLLGLYSCNLFINTGEIVMNDNMFYKRGIEEEPDRDAVLENTKFDPEEIVGLENFRRYAKQGRINYAKFG